MPISVSCPCGKTLNVKDELAGKRGKCPKCGALLTIPQMPKPAALEPLDLPSLSDEFDQPAPAEVIPEAVRLARAKSGWVDPSIETEFKLAGDPLSDDVGKVFTPPPTIAPLKDRNAPREEKEGEFVCPRCGCGLERTYSLLNILTMYASAYTTGSYLRPRTPYLCRVCDAGIRYEDLRGESRRTADRRAAKFKLGCLIAFLTVGGFFGGCILLVYPKFKEEQRQKQEQREEREKQQKIEREKFQQEQEKLEEQRTEKKELERKQREAESQRIKDEYQKKYEELKRAREEERLKNLSPPTRSPSNSSKPPPPNPNPSANSFQPVD